MQTKDVDKLVDAIKADADSVVSVQVDPDITWYMSKTVDQMKAVRAVIEAAKAWRHGAPERYLLAGELLSQVDALEALEAAEGE